MAQIKPPAKQRRIRVYANWHGLDAPAPMGVLTASLTRGEEIFAFEYEHAWLEGAHRLTLDPHLSLFGGPQYAPGERGNFGLFLDSSPDRWGRLIMDRREARDARREARAPRKLLASDYLLGVHDAHRIGALRFKTTSDGPFLDNRTELAAPPLASLRELEAAAMGIDSDDAENNPAFDQWLRLLIAPGGSLGGARPKAGVIDKDGALWIAKFPSTRDTSDTGAWEMVVHELARAAGIDVADSRAQRFAAKHHTFITRRFDRTPIMHRPQLCIVRPGGMPISEDAAEISSKCLYIIFAAKTTCGPVQGSTVGNVSRFHSQRLIANERTQRRGRRPVTDAMYCG